MELQIHRGELISRYAPKSVMISDVDRQISEARRLLAQEQANTVEIYRKDTQARIDATQARMDALLAQLSEYREKAAKLDTIAPEWERLQNELDTRRQAYQTYLQKEEEARFTNALDESQILNVTVAELATPPLRARIRPRSSSSSSSARVSACSWGSAWRSCVIGWILRSRRHSKRSV
jgi:uncharacterized protein involved in exopolysaccharide biosynthesis